MKILFCSENVVSQELGASRVLLGIAAGLSRLGWECRIVDRMEMAKEVSISGEPSTYPEVMRGYLLRHAADYDVVDYDNHHLPFPRSEFVHKTLFVARSVLLMDHLLEVSPPELKSVYVSVKGWLSGVKTRKRKQLQRWVQNGHITALNADLVNVANQDDARVLQAAGIDQHKICVIPYGLSEAEFTTLSQVSLQAEAVPRICFLGTFDERKGGSDLIELCQRIGKAFPTCRFRLAGTAGLYQSSKEVFSFFPRWIREAIDVIPRFERSELPKLLDGCTAGAFPSYAEGFGFGVLEMMAAGIPVVAYRSPGPPMMLTDDFLVPRGDIAALCEKLRILLTCEDYRRTSSLWSRERARQFSWDQAAALTQEDYCNALRRLRVDH